MKQSELDINEQWVTLRGHDNDSVRVRVGDIVGLRRVIGGGCEVLLKYGPIQRVAVDSETMELLEALTDSVNQKVVYDDGVMFRVWIQMIRRKPTAVALALAECDEVDQYRDALVKLLKSNL